MLSLLTDGEDDCSAPVASHCLIRGYEAIDGRSTNILSQSRRLYWNTTPLWRIKLYITQLTMLYYRLPPFSRGGFCVRLICVDIKAFRRVIALHQDDAVFVGATNKSTLFACLHGVRAYAELHNNTYVHCFLLYMVIHL